MATDTAIQRRREISEIIDYLKSDLYERNRDYSNSSFEIGSVVYDPETEMLWGSPLGWRVTIKVFDDQSIILGIYKPDGSVYRMSPPIMPSDFGYGVGVGWLEDQLP